MAMSLSWITDSIDGQAPFVDPGRSAVAFDDGTPLTWAELRQAELRCARSLQQAGVSRGDRVGLLLRNSLDYTVFYLAIARVGAISVRLNFRLTAPELGFILNDSGVTPERPRFTPGTPRRRGSARRRRYPRPGAPRRCADRARAVPPARSPDVRRIAVRLRAEGRHRSRRCCRAL